MEIAISGIAGKFPKCENVEELKEKLLSGAELTTNKLPWEIDDEAFPKRMGRLRTFKEFDAGYFGILPKQADMACPMSRMLLEAAYEAIVDAGINPDTIKNTNTGVYIGSCCSESTQAIQEPMENRNVARGTLTVTSSVLSGRISFWLGVTGPSIVVDTGCSTTLTVLDLAYRDLISGRCSQALVGGANMIALPFLTRLMAQDCFLSKEGRCFSFDDAASGFVRAEGVAMVFLQAVENSKRIYCKIVGSRIGCEGFKEKGLTQTSGPGQVNFLRQCYQEAKLNPLNVGYIEAHGPGTGAGDPEEAFALDVIFNIGRTEPLTIGSVKSNLGHCEPVAGLTGLIKVILAMESGTMPGTLHFKTPNSNIPALIEGRIQIHNQNKEFDEKFAAVNSFGLGGSLAHVIVERHNKIKPKHLQNDDGLPWMVLCSGRTQEAVNYMCQKATAGVIDPEMIGLIHNIHSKTIKNHLYRGFSIKGRQGNITGSTFYSGEKRPICFAFTGMGSQWFRMGKELLKLPVFAESIEKCANILDTKKIDLYKIITDEEPGMFDFILNAFVGIIAIQIALVDVLHDLGIKPDIIIGQSLGELSCGYADGTLTLEQTILAAFYRGLVSVESVFVPGTMAAVGMSCEELKKQMPEGVEIACYNGPKSIIISGKKAPVLQLCRKLSDKKIFVKEVPWACGIPYHSSHMSKAGSKFLTYLKEVIPTPCRRSSKWISSSVPESNWDSDLASFSSAEYHFNNFCKPVLFYDAFQKVPDNAIVIEIAPHGLMESVIKQFGKSNIDYISLSDKNSPNLQFSLCALGRIYLSGGLPQISRLYPSVAFPVSRGTKMISPLVRWDHSQNWHIPVYDDPSKLGHFIKIINPSDCKNEEVWVDGVSCYPFSNCLVDVWKTLARVHGKLFSKFTVMFENVVFHMPILLTDVKKKVSTEVKKETGYFEVLIEDQLHISGYIKSVDPFKSQITLKVQRPRPSKYDLPLTRDDIYKELRLRGLRMCENYKVATFVDFSFSVAELEWSGNWAIALECFSHLMMIQKETRLIQRPSKLKKLILDPIRLPPGKITCYLDSFTGMISCDGIQMIGMEFQEQCSTIAHAEPLLEKQDFCPHIKTDSTLYDVVHLSMHLLVENLATHPVRILEFRPNGNRTDLIAAHLKMAFDNIPTVQCEVISYGVPPVSGVQSFSNLSDIPDNSRHVVVCNSSILGSGLDPLHFLHPNGFLLVEVKKNEEILVPNFNICVDHQWDNGRLVVLKKAPKKPFTPIIVHLRDEVDYDWLATLQENENNEETLLLVAYQPTSGIMGLVYTLLQEMGIDKIRGVFTFDQSVPPFSAKNNFYKEQLEKNLVVNVFKNGAWGSYRHIPFITSHKESTQIIYTPHALLEGPLNRMHAKDLDLVTVQFSSIRAANFKWLEYSGKSANGTRVMGYQKLPSSYLMVPSKIVPDREAMWEIPANWSISDAASSVLPYCKAIIALQFVTNISDKNSILVVGADFSDGFAVLSLALQMSCQVYASCENKIGVETLNALLPKLPAENISLQSDVGVLRDKYQAFDVIVSFGTKMTAEEANCLRPHGTILQIGHSDEFCLRDLPESVSIKKIEISNYLEMTKNRLYYSFQALLDANIPPIKSQIIKHSDVDFSMPGNPDKVSFERRVLRWRGDEKFARPQVCFNERQSFVIVGGLGGFGLELISWMIKRGASKFVICTRSSVKTGYQSYMLRSWKAKGIEVLISTEDVTSDSGTKTILNQATSLGPVGGIFQLALTLEMGLLRNLTVEMFHSMTATRFLAAKFLDQHSRSLCPELQHFVMFSSYVSGRGNMGQANYAYASSRMDRLMEVRKAEGLPALAIQWGPIGEVGALADAAETGVQGTEFQHIISCLATLDNLLDCEDPVVASCVLKPKTSVTNHEITASARVAELMGIKDISTISPQATLAELGMDSILAVNIKSSLADDFHIVLSLFEVRNLTFSKCIALSEES